MDESCDLCRAPLPYTRETTRDQVFLISEPSRDMGTRQICRKCVVKVLREVVNMFLPEV